ncbi:hypothetical protein BDV97DRAFT_368977 [Delphinella strobiligena]|nr:hypothetical protein BDV97DRAFT_368977 [Delphinella strobiligena]
MRRSQTLNACSERRHEPPSREDTPVRDRKQQLPWDARDTEYLWRSASGPGQPNYARINGLLPIAPNRRSAGALRLQYFKLRESLKKALKDASTQNFAPDSNQDFADSLCEWMEPIFHIAVAHRPTIAQINELDPLTLFIELEYDDVVDQETEDADIQRPLPLAIGLEDDDVMDQETVDVNVQRPRPWAQPLPEILQKGFAKFAPVNREHPWVKYGLPPLTRELQ